MRKIMSAYVIFTRVRTIDRAEMKIYNEASVATIQGHPVKILAAYGAKEVLEGPEHEGISILEFPTMQDAKAWYDSPAYRRVREHRFKGAEYRGVIVEGV
jgi:uncharacterized protein (DUF1330 family)